MAEFPSMPLFWDAYWADTPHLSMEEHGLYLNLIGRIWRAPNQRVPNDDAWLASRLGVDVTTVRNQLRPLIKEFCQTDGNWIKQKRISREFNFVSSQRQKQSERANARWHKNKELSRGSTTSGIAASGIAPTLTPTKTLSEEEGTGVPSSSSRVVKEKDIPSEYPKRKPGSTSLLPPDFPDQAALEQARGFWASKLRLDLDPQEQADQFRDHHTAHGTRFSDWQAAWRTWMRNALKFNRRSSGNGQSAQGTYATNQSSFIEKLRVTATQDLGGRRQSGNGADIDPTGIIEGTARLVDGQAQGGGDGDHTGGDGRDTGAAGPALRPAGFQPNPRRSDR